MYARVVSISVRPDRMQECIRIFKEVNGPSIARQAGFEHGHWWADRDSGEAVSVTFWDSAEHEQASRADIPSLIEGMAHVLGSHEISQRSYERVHDQQPLARWHPAQTPGNHHRAWEDERGVSAGDDHRRR